jgi:ubiquinone/menaquinone biosynthesis C-methylase UbiE
VQPAYIPALRFRALTPWYDFIIQATIRERAFKSKLIQQASLHSEDRILDLGCGTGTLTILLKSQHPDAEVAAIDADPQILTIARDKAARAGLDISFHQVMSEALPFPDASFDHVFSSLLFHHLKRDQKLGTLGEVLRILRPGGHLHIADFGRPQNAPLRAAFYFVQIFDGFTTTQDNVDGLLPRLINEAGFPPPNETATFATMFGTIRLLQTEKLK